MNVSLLRILFLSSALLVPACNRVAEIRSPAIAATARQAGPALQPGQDSAARLLGEWDIVSFEGYRPRRLSGTVRVAFADFSANGVRLSIECNSSGRGGKFEGGRFVHAPQDGNVQTQMGCGKEREARDERYFSFFDKSPQVELSGNGRLRLWAEGSELILERPSVHRLAYLRTLAELQGKWRLSEITYFVPPGGYSGIGLSEVPGHIVVTGERISYDGCPQYAAQFRFTEDGRLAKVGGAELPASLVDCRGLSAAPMGHGMPAPSDVLRVLHSSPMAEKSGREVVLSTSQNAVLLTNI